MTSDPNPLPLTYGVLNDPGPTSINARRSTRLTTLNLDVQTHIMSFLSKQDLSALMKTCRYFLDACIPSLCAHSGDLLHEIDLTVLPNFHKFLRIDAGPLSRAHLIKELWVAVSNTLYYYNEIAGPDKGNIFVQRKQWSSAFLAILRHCHNLRRLRVDLWFDDDIPFPLFVETISSLQHLDDLELFLPQRLQDADLDVLRELAGPPLRRLAFLKYNNSYAPNLHRVPLEGLPRSLVELEIDVCMPVSRPFPNVRTLGVRVPTSETFVADATTAFPNVTQLILRTHVMTGGFMIRSLRGPGPLVQRARAHNRIQWRSEQYRETWPSLSAIWVRDLYVLYAAGFLRRVLSISIPFRYDREEPYLAMVLADTSPSFLELRVSLNDIPLPPPNWQLLSGPSTSSVLRLKALLETGNRKRRWGDGRKEERLFVRLCGYLLLLENIIRLIPTLRRTQGEICAMLQVFTSLTHLFIQFAPMETSYEGIDSEEWPSLSRNETHAVEAAIQKYLLRFGQASASLRWVAFRVYDLALECWEISCAGEGGSQSQNSWTKTSAEEGLAVLDGEGMNVFRDVRQRVSAVMSSDIGENEKLRARLRVLYPEES